MERRIRVAVIFGGQSGEHEVSLASARSVMAALPVDKYEIVPVGITHTGRWLTGADSMQRLSAPEPGEDRPADDAGVRRIAEEGTDHLHLSASSADPASTGRELVPGATGSRFPPVDVVFPVLHGPFGEDGTVQGLLELSGLPYVGSGVLASALGMDKIASRAAFATYGLPQVAYRPVKRRDWEAAPREVMAALEAALGYPMFVKPANLGSSVGISKAHDRAGLQAALAEAARYDRKLIVEAAVPNAREIECSVLGNDDPIASVPGEVVPSNEFYDYAAKYIDGDSQLLIPAPLPAETARRIRELAVLAFKALDCAGLARVDFLVNRETGELFLNEINTMPGFTRISMYPKLWEATGIPYAELVDRLIELALERHEDKSRSETTYGGAMPAGDSA